MCVLKPDLRIGLRRDKLPHTSCFARKKNNLMLWFQIQFDSVATITAGRCPEDYFNISSSVVLANVETQAETAVTGWAALFPQHYPLCIPI